MTVGSQLRALEAKTESLVSLLQGLGPEGWSRPTRCSPLNVRELAGHLLVSYGALGRVASQPSLGGEADQDWITWWHYDPEEIGPWCFALPPNRRRPSPSRIPPGPSPLRPGGRSALSQLGSRPRTRCARPFFGTVRLRDFVVTRVVEVCVHALDLRHALGLQPRSSQEGLHVAATTLRALLGSDPPAGMDELRFVLVGTGREPLGDDERHSLGRAAQRFPLIA